ncbi:putative vacuolar iron transporter protein [Cladorrhinum sp. PSN332]|nr:putative vacuolar iron transporter protein [Cladorrhinum sp. PSN332]
MGGQPATSSQDSLPTYESLPIASRRSSSEDQLSFASSPSSAACSNSQHHHSPTKSSSQSISLTAFLSNLTLGFADGLTVPFALTAGLSSLGNTKTVIYAGVAEICAGSISMGIGGYLAARGERQTPTPSPSPSPSPSPTQCSADLSDSASEGLLHEDEKFSTEQRYLITRLNLPSELEEKVMRHLSGGGKKQLDVTNEPEKQDSPALSGLSVSVGYLLGGALPLFPYFFMSPDDDPARKGLVWSFVVCVVALFVFGFGKQWVLGYGRGSGTGNRSRLRVCALEGMQMVVLGSVAAGTAVLCVKAFEGL